MKVKIVYKSDGSVKMDKHTHIYGLNTITGKVTRSDLMPLDKTDGILTYRLIEQKNYMYMPAASLELAQSKFDIVFRHAKFGTLKLSKREWLAKWLTVLTIKWRSLWHK